MVKHIVLFAYTEPLSHPKIIEIDSRFKELPSLIEEIVHFECGTDMSIEGLTKGYDKVYVLSFKSEKDRDTYIHHPIHQDFVTMAKPFFKDVLVFDYIPE